MKHKLEKFESVRKYIKFILCEFFPPEARWTMDEFMIKGLKHLPWYLSPIGDPAAKDPPEREKAANQAIWIWFRAKIARVFQEMGILCIGRGQVYVRSEDMSDDEYAYKQRSGQENITNCTLSQADGRYRRNHRLTLDQPVDRTSREWQQIRSEVCQQTRRDVMRAS